MANQTIINSEQGPDVHDGIVFSVKYLRNIFRTLFNKCILRVLLLTDDQRLLIVTFFKVHSANINSAEGMIISSLSEMSATPPFRRFVFVNRELNRDRHLEVIAQEFLSIELTDDILPRDQIDAVVRHIRSRFNKSIQHLDL